MSDKTSLPSKSMSGSAFINTFWDRDFVPAILLEMGLRMLSLNFIGNQKVMSKATSRLIIRRFVNVIFNEQSNIFGFLPQQPSIKFT